jgi:hypothetical protein
MKPRISENDETHAVAESYLTSFDYWGLPIV